MKKITITVGLSGSGKSTWAKAFCQENPNWLRINRDEIRKSMLAVSLNEYHEWDKDAKYRIEKLVTAQHNQLLVKALEGGWNVILDNTHLKLSYLNEYRKLLTEHFESFEITYQVFETPLAQCLLNDQNRATSRKLENITKKYPVQDRNTHQRKLPKRARRDIAPRYFGGH
jgi:predicted kinase